MTRNKLIPKAEQATAHALKIVGNAADPRIRELVASGLMFSATGASAQTIIQASAPFMAEIQMDFILAHYNDTEDTEARDLAHKAMRDMIGHGVKLGVVDKVIEASAEEREKEAEQFDKLFALVEAANKSGKRLDQMLREGVQDAEVVE